MQEQDIRSPARRQPLKKATKKKNQEPGKRKPAEDAEKQDKNRNKNKKKT